MAAKLSDLVIMSDVDGTILNAKKEIPPNNITAIERFVSKGGHFAIASGRSVDYGNTIAEHFPVNYPCVYFNGGVLYDPVSQTNLMDIYLPDSAREIVEAVSARFPMAGALVVNAENYYAITTLETLAQAGYSNPRIEPRDIDKIMKPWYKALFFVPREHNTAFNEFVAQYTDVRFVATNEILIEMLPLNCSKGFALERLMDIKGLEREHLVCIGDFYNDREMIELAGIGVTMETAPADLQALAQMIVCDCESGSLADLVAQLERQFDA